MPYWSEDIGGFFRPDDQYTSTRFHALLTRWFQFGCFTPIFRIHGTNGASATVGTEYWNYGDEVLANMNATNNLRHRLLPYIYSLAARVERDGYTLQRALAFDFPADAAAIAAAGAARDTFLFGPSLLVAPVLDEALARAARSARRGERTAEARISLCLPAKMMWFESLTVVLPVGARDPRRRTTRRRATSTCRARRPAAAMRTGRASGSARRTPRARRSRPRPRRSRRSRSSAARAAFCRLGRSCSTSRRRAPTRSSCASSPARTERSRSTRCDPRGVL